MLEKLIVFVEEPSMEAALEHLLPKMLADTDFEIRRFQCKDDLLKQLPARLRGFSAWLPASWALVILVDRDDDDCHELKRKMEQVAARGRAANEDRHAARPTLPGGQPDRRRRIGSMVFR